jgi:hypothetical protein
LSNVNYQDEVNASLDRENDMDAFPELEGDESEDSIEAPNRIHKAIQKVFFL